MGNTCSSVKKSSKESSKTKERKESAESIPYGHPNSESASINQKPDTINSETLQISTAIAPSSSVSQKTSITETVPPDSKPHESCSSTAPARTTVGSPSPFTSLSPVPTASSPSPYSSSADGAQPHISPTRGHINLNQYPNSVRANSFTQLFHLRNDFCDDEEARNLENFYLIAISTESDELVVWSVYDEKPVRTIRKVPKPRDVRMVDQYRAVILCNRELMMLDIDQAILKSKLKGVMNQKMPFYGLHSDKYVVALSRNRMYVNMINLGTGDLETTFKAGEDRFLNSLLTSANGKICVCGDETQKPFPLLVWDLFNRKLLYDLRMPHHEFITTISAISDDGHYVVSVCQECNNSSKNFLIVYDLQSGTLFKKWKPEFNSVSVAISAQCGSCVINGIENNDVLIWDLSTGNIKYTLSGHTAPPDLLEPALKSNVFLSYNSSRKDEQLRIWSLDTGECLWIYEPKKEISCCTLTSNGMAIVFGYVGEKKLNLVLRQSSQNEEDSSDDLKDYVETMCSKIVPYGKAELSGQIFDLN